MLFYKIAKDISKVVASDSNRNELNLLDNSSPYPIQAGTSRVDSRDEILNNFMKDKDALEQNKESKVEIKKKSSRCNIYRDLHKSCKFYFALKVGVIAVCSVISAVGSVIVLM